MVVMTAHALTFVCAVMLAVWSARCRCQSTPTSVTPLPLNAQYSSAYLYTAPFENITYDFVPSSIPALGREGVVYASEGEAFMYWGGGVNLDTGETFSDLYLLDTINDLFTACSPALPSAVYYSSTSWCEPLQSLIIYGGLSSAPSAPDTYLQSVLLLNLSTTTSALCQFTASSVTPAMPGRKFASSVLINTVLFVYGGYNAVAPLQSGQLWFSIDLIAGSTSPLSVAASQGGSVAPGVISAALIADASGLLIYVYGGLTAPVGVDGSSWAPNKLMYRFDVERGIWISPITPFTASNSAQLLSYPLIGYACQVPADSTGEKLIVVGGTDGFDNSLDVLVLIDVSTDSTLAVGAPTIATLYATLPMGLQSCAVGTQSAAGADRADR